MDEANEYVPFLSREENLRVALKIEEYINDVKNNLHRGFWLLIESHVNDRLDKNGLRKSWRVVHRDEYPLTGDVGGLKIVPSDHNTRSVSAVVNIEQKCYKDCQVVYGLWCHPWEDSAFKKFAPVGQELRARFDSTFSINKNDRVPVLHHTEYRANSRETLLSVAREKHDDIPGVAYDMATQLFEFFEASRSTIEEMNERLSIHSS